MEAHRGTCFFDEIGTLPLALQPKLLRAIDAGSFRPVGADSDSWSDFRLLGATNESVRRLVRLGRFREDLAFRLGGVVIAVPPLCDRIEDVPMLAQHFASGSTRTQGGAVRWSSDALRALQDYDWPGNVRELKHAVERVIAFADGPVIGAADVRRHSDTLGALAAESAWDERRRDELREVLRSVNWDTGKAAAILGVDRTTVYRRMRRLGISIPQRRVDLGHEADA
jgi:transcriptional regulator with GAF, ATPase, and Fis domain